MCTQTVTFNDEFTVPDFASTALCVVCFVHMLIDFFIRNVF